MRLQWLPANLVGKARHSYPTPTKLVYVNVEDTLHQLYNYAKKEADHRYTGVRITPLLAIILIPTSAPAIAAVRLCKGSTDSVRGGTGSSPTR